MDIKGTLTCFEKKKFNKVIVVHNIWSIYLKRGIICMEKFYTYFLSSPKSSNFGNQLYERLENTLREVVLGMDHLESVPKLDLACLMLPKPIPSQIVIRKAVSQPC